MHCILFPFKYFFLLTSNHQVFPLSSMCSACLKSVRVQQCECGRVLQITDISAQCTLDGNSGSSDSWCLGPMSECVREQLRRGSQAPDWFAMPSAIVTNHTQLFTFQKHTKISLTHFGFFFLKQCLALQPRLALSWPWLCFLSAQLQAQLLYLAQFLILIQNISSAQGSGKQRIFL